MEGVWARGQSADGAQVDDVTTHFRVHHAFNVGANLELVTTASRTKVINASNLVRVTNAARALNATGHDRLDERAEVLVFDGTLATHLVEARAVTAVAHRLVLEVALTTPVADRAVQRVVHKQKLHDALARLGDKRRVGENFLARHGRKCARGQRLRGANTLDETHTAVTRHVELR